MRRTAVNQFRNQKSYRKLGRTEKHRVAMMRNMVTSLIHHDRIKTTLPKAKDLRRWADKLVTLAKRDSTNSAVSAKKVVRDELAFLKLWHVLGPRYQNRNGGYTRVLKAGRRYGDAAEMAYIEFIDREGEIRPAKPASGIPKPKRRGLLDLLDSDDSEKTS